MVAECAVEVQGPLHQDAVVGPVAAGSVTVRTGTCIVGSRVPGAAVVGSTALVEVSLDVQAVDDVVLYLTASVEYGRLGAVVVLCHSVYWVTHIVLVEQGTGSALEP